MTFFIFKKPTDINVSNVKDFGAIGDGTTDDTTAVQAAVDWTSGANRGTIYFPPGTYKVTAPITFNYAGALSICFRGEGAVSSINGTVNTGYILDRHLGSPSNQATVVIEKLSISNNSGTAGTGGIRLGSTISGIIRDCAVGGFNCITTEDATGVSSQNILMDEVRPLPSNAIGGHGIIMGGAGAILGCDVHGADTGMRLYGSGWTVFGCRVERCNTAYLLGVDSAGTDQGASGFSMVGGTTEGCVVNMDFSGTCSGFFISAINFLNHLSPNCGPDPGTGSPERGIWIRANKASGGVISGVSAGGDACTVAQIQVDAATNRSDILFVGCTATVLRGGGAPYVFPSNAYTAQFQNCNSVPIWTFSQLPTGGNVLEGDEFDISDGTDGLTWGQTVTNTGTHTTHYRVRYNGANWTVVGK